ncbi:PIN domain-containing protein [Leifsonia sp. TF02-11]|uniref:PIN domain-containing protein n=1 Tax=Leifsonia sp. TF02-11 TaxID=2815212 RepID=UPI001AA19050|nr:PIN domain-containing protein [Leifsonia sp. TF02-11]MBO1740503.1 hypothetical protein [Leifsonia sp. TF02-11]
MSWFGQRYVLDTNALSQLRRHRRASEFFREHAVIPAEVLHEAQGFPDFDVLRANIYPTTSKVLDWLVTIMATVPAEDTKLLDLYANHGGADPLVVACALDGKTQDDQFLGAPEWIIVTSDAAVRTKAEEFSLRVLNSAEFAAVIDAADGLKPSQGPLLPRTGISYKESSSRTCAQCGRDCMPEPFQHEQGFRIALTCPEHGVHSVLDPFADSQ